MTKNAERNRTALLPALEETIRLLVTEFESIPRERKGMLLQLTRFIVARRHAGQHVQLSFICTHNSRRSHMAQLWATAAAQYYNVGGVECFSGGTEATAFNPRAVSAMQRAGFGIRQQTPGPNPVYEVSWSPKAELLKAFSKIYNDAANPSTGFAAIMTCSHAAENCPFVPGASSRIALPYDDPKAFDNTASEQIKYDERVREIGRDMLYAFSGI